MEEEEHAQSADQTGEGQKEKNSFGNKVQGGVCTAKIPKGWGHQWVGGTNEPARGYGKEERKAPRWHKASDRVGKHSTAVAF